MVSNPACSASSLPCACAASKGSSICAAEAGRAGSAVRSRDAVQSAHSTHVLYFFFSKIRMQIISFSENNIL
jgi:hypothetical protein